MLYFRNEGRHGTGNLKKDQPPLDKNSEDLAMLILEFDNVTVKTIYCFLSSLEWSVGGPFWGSTVCTVPDQDLLKSPFK